MLRGKNKYTGNYFFYLSPAFYICTLIVDIIVKNNQLRIICNIFQEILSKSKEMTFTETNKGFVYEWLPFNSLDKETYIYAFVLQSVDRRIKML